MISNTPTTLLFDRKSAYVNSTVGRLVVGHRTARDERGTNAQDGAEQHSGLIASGSMLAVGGEPGCRLENQLDMRFACLRDGYCR